MTAKTHVDCMSMCGKSQQSANNQMSIVNRPANQAIHHPAKLRKKAKTDKTAGKIASLLNVSRKQKYARVSDEQHISSSSSPF